MMYRLLVAVAAFALSFAASMARAEDAPKLDVVKLTIGQRGNWDTAITYLGSKAGIFKRYGLELDMVYTSGSGETLQPVIAGAVDAGLAVGTLGAMSAFAKGAPVRIIAAEATGAADYWYSRTSSPIRTLRDTNGHTIAYSTRGSSTDSIVRAFITEFGLTAKPVATGNPSATLAAVMSDQVDVGWSSPPYGLKEMEDGKIRLVAKATDAAIVRDQTIRVIVANANALEARPDVFRRFMQAYRDSIDYMYGDSPQVIIDYAAFVGVPDSMARRVRDDFFPRSLVNPDEIKGIDSLMHEAVELKFIAEPLTKEQLAQLIQLQPPMTH
ncbi:MAG: ABC transporter substrate-binding protein [Xanthobacteraceae bacterium]|nr:ABC transporter substrate-binding protein [Xanthobacteraceae bacterium]